MTVTINATRIAIGLVTTSGDISEIASHFNSPPPFMTISDCDTYLPAPYGTRKAIEVIEMSALSVPYMPVYTANELIKLL
ncbi:hypothetical protein JTE90_024823 [Oedothorax gibbosus]|uniref:Uncharacterized protein n=1 Tax=Oedothorax gibbosus TaxID=931172 RepID=A0AAV6TVD6_9ARAC|nr:hypothetical protein JTE90_024823 [Oedothorax gibbosus]